MSEGSTYKTTRKYMGIIDAYPSELPLGSLGDRFHADEIRQKIHGKNHYVFGIMDHKT